MRYIFIAWAVAVVISLYGYVENILKLLHILNDPVSGMLIARVAGIFVAPLGVILGFC